MSLHRAIVVDNDDPARLGRLKVIVPALSEESSNWASCVMPLGGAHPPPPTAIGTGVWVAFEADDADHPVVLGEWSTDVVTTPVELAAELGHDDGDRPGRKVREFLREQFPDHGPNSRWFLTAEQADAVRSHFRE